MSAIAYFEEAAAILRSKIKAELDGIKGELDKLVAVLRDDTSHRANALAAAGSALQAVSLMAGDYEPTHEQKALAGVSNTPTPKPLPPEPVVVEKAAPKVVTVKPVVEKKK